MDVFLRDNKNLKFWKYLVFTAVPMVVLIFASLYAISGITKFSVNVKMPNKHSLISEERIRIIARHAEMNDTLQSGSPIISITSKNIRERLASYNRFSADISFYSEIIEKDSAAISLVNKIVNEQFNELDSLSETKSNIDKKYFETLTKYSTQSDSIYQLLLRQLEILNQKDLEAPSIVGEKRLQAANNYTSYAEKLYELNSRINRFRIEPADYQIQYQNALRNMENSLNEFRSILHQAKVGKKKIENQLKLQFGEFSLDKSSLTLGVPGNDSIILTYLTNEENIAQNSTVYSYTKNNAYYFEAKVPPEIRAKIKENNKARILFTYSSFLDISFIEGQVKKLSATADENGLYLIGIAPEKNAISDKIWDQLSGTAYVF